MKSAWIYHEIAQAKTQTRYISPDDSILRCLENSVKPHANDMMVELGCGSGLRSLYLAKKHSLEPVLIDYTRFGVSLTKDNAEKLGVSCHIVRCDLKHLPFRNEIFDIVWAEGIHEHMLIGDRPLAFDETRRIARSGAQLLILVPNFLNPIYRIEEMIKGKFHVAELYEIPFPRSDLAYWIRRSGFTVTGREGIEVFYTFFTYSTINLTDMPPIIRPLYRIKRFITRSCHSRNGIMSYTIQILRRLDRNILPQTMLGHEIGVVAVAN